MNFIKSFNLFENILIKKSELIAKIQQLKSDLIAAMNYANSKGAGINLSFGYGKLKLGELFKEIDNLNPTIDNDYLLFICHEISLLGKYDDDRNMKKLKDDEFIFFGTASRIDLRSYDILKYEFSQKIKTLTLGTKWDVTNIPEKTISEEDIEDIREIIKDIKLDNINDIPEDLSIEISKNRYGELYLKIASASHSNCQSLFNIFKSQKQRIDHIFGISHYTKYHNRIEILFPFSKLEIENTYKLL